MFKPRFSTLSPVRSQMMGRPISLLRTGPSLINTRSFYNTDSRLDVQRKKERQAVAKETDPFTGFLSDWPFGNRNMAMLDISDLAPFSPADWLDIRSPVTSAAARWRPKVDLHESDKELTITAELPGMTKDDIKVEIKDNTLVIKGEKKMEKKEEEDKYTRIERAYGSFIRRIPLPEGLVDQSQVKANYTDGVLKLIIPKIEKEEDKPVQIDIQ